MKTAMIFFLFCLLAAPFAFSQQTSMPLSEGVELVTSGVCASNVSLTPPARYPEFTTTITTQGPQTCAATLTALNGTPNPSGISGYQDLKGMYVNIDVPAGSRSNADILFTWTVRIEGYKPLAHNPQLIGCGSSWYGTTIQTFVQGDVMTALFVNINGQWVQKSGDKKMTLPSAGVGSLTLTPPPPPRDPTQTSTYVLTPDDFGGEFPAAIEAKVMWKNDSSMDIVSPSGQRELVATLLGN